MLTNKNYCRFLFFGHFESNLIVFSVSPCHVETRSELDNEKNVLFVAAVAAAFARYDFPVPGGLKSKILKCKMLSAIKTN